MLAFLPWSAVSRTKRCLCSLDLLPAWVTRPLPLPAVLYSCDDTSPAEHLMYSNYGPGYNDNGQLRSRSGRLQARARKFMAAAAPSPRPAPRRAAGRLVEGQQAQMLPRSSTDSRALLLSASLKYLGGEEARKAPSR
eukprot:763407-Hanusia_phi.AAC.1